MVLVDVTESIDVEGILQTAILISVLKSQRSCFCTFPWRQAYLRVIGRLRVARFLKPEHTFACTDGKLQSSS